MKLLNLSNRIERGFFENQKAEITIFTRYEICNFSLVFRILSFIVKWTVCLESSSVSSKTILSGVVLKILELNST